jgi:uncharacterized damage-inducible protein DinB
MPLAVSIEQMETQWIAHASTLPGCYFSHAQREQALAGLPQAVRAYMDWCRWNGVLLAGMQADAPLEVQEIAAEWQHPQTGAVVHAFFAADAPPLSSAETTLAAGLLDWTRADLQKAISGLPEEILSRSVEGEWNIRGIFYHSARADWRYLRALELAPDWPHTAASAQDESGLHALLEWTQELYLRALPGLAGQGRVVLHEGELWSPRKMIRRALWHRRDHTAHIYQFREALSAG